MQVTGEDNATGLKVYINGVPDLRQIPEDIAEATILALETSITQAFMYRVSEPTNEQE